MGILDNKTRILDAILTAEGRRQIAEGTFNVTHVTFEDGSMVYQPDSEEGHVDPTDRIYLEASTLPQDQIIFETNDSGKLVPLRDRTLDLQRIDSLLPRRVAASFVDGKAVAFQINYGARVKVSTLSSKFKETGVGFYYTDSMGLSSSIILDPTRAAGSITSSLPQYMLVGTKGGINAIELASSIQRAIEVGSLLSGPKIEAVDREDFIYLTDASGSHEKVLTRLITGSMGSPTASVPFVLEQSFKGGRADFIDLPNSVFASQIDGLLTSSFDNFQELRSLSTIEPIFMEDKFVLSENNIQFDIGILPPEIITYIRSTPSLNSIDSLFNDDKMSNLINFRYLPPIVKTNSTLLPDKTNIDNLQPYLLGDYPPLGDNKNPISFMQIKEQLKSFSSKTIDFIETTRKNNLLCQVFEVANGTVTKLDIVEYGDVKNDELDPNVVSNKVYFLGKTYLDDRGTTSYVNMFTLIFSRRESVEE